MTIETTPGPARRLLAPGQVLDGHRVLEELPSDWFSFGVGFRAQCSDKSPGILVLLHEDQELRQLPEYATDIPDPFIIGDVVRVPTTKGDLTMLVLWDLELEHLYLPDPTLGVGASARALLQVVEAYAPLARRHPDLLAAVDARDLFAVGGDLAVLGLDLSPGAERRPLQSALAEVAARSLGRAMPPPGQEAATASAIETLQHLTANPPRSFSPLRAVLLGLLPRGARLHARMTHVVSLVAGTRIPWLRDRAQGAPAFLRTLRPVLEYPTLWLVLVAWLVGWWIGVISGSVLAGLGGASTGAGVTYLWMKRSQR